MVEYEDSAQNQTNHCTIVKSIVLKSSLSELLNQSLDNAFFVNCIMNVTDIEKLILSNSMPNKCFYS